MLLPLLLPVQASSNGNAAAPAKRGLLGSFVGKLALSVVGSSALSAADLAPALEDMKRRLMERNVAEEIAAQVVDSVAHSLEGQKLSSFTGALVWSCVCSVSCGGRSASCGLLCCGWQLAAGTMHGDAAMRTCHHLPLDATMCYVHQDMGYQCYVFWRLTPALDDPPSPLIICLALRNSAIADMCATCAQLLQVWASLCAARLRTRCLAS
jgi:hypothetical protein